ncbi:hypothetical protein MG293_019260 [Ovis ammon polii]|uniref:Uncharacterized protein n=1 Tax=Ovis ammon polii TaxID=230172 RepID=A0AAD4TPK0_OVIAM|nr:hypothetical protein MG293_019260 [Ovis ammon polii]
MYSKQVDEVRGKPCLPAALVHKPPGFPSRKASPGGLPETSPLRNGSPTMLMTPRCQGKEEQSSFPEAAADGRLFSVSSKTAKIDMQLYFPKCVVFYKLATRDDLKGEKELTNQPPGRSPWAPPEEVGLGGSCSGHLRAGGPEQGAIPLCRPEGFTCGWSTENRQEDQRGGASVLSVRSLGFSELPQPSDPANRYLGFHISLSGSLDTTTA